MGKLDDEIKEKGLFEEYAPDIIYIDKLNEIIGKVVKEFPWKELNFFDPRDTREAEDIRKHVYDWFKKWFGEVED